MITRSQAREVGFFIRSQATKIFLPPATGILGGGWALPGWALPIYINRHPQPPAKFNRFYGICQDNYFTYPQK